MRSLSNALLLSLMVLIICGASCEVIYPKKERETPERNPVLTSEEQELLDYCKNVKNISERQEETENKVEKILSLVEEDKITPIRINAQQREELRKSWVEIENSKKKAIKVLHDDSSPDSDSGAAAH